MTLAESVALLRTRVEVDNDADVDISNNDVAVTAIMAGARDVSRDAMHLWTWNSALTLVATVTEYNLLTAAASPVFSCYGVHINDDWLTKVEPSRWVEMFPDYTTASSVSRPAWWTPVQPSHIKIADPPNATAVAATDNFVIGFRYHLAYTWENANANLSSTASLEGPLEYHDLIVDAAYLRVTKSYVAGSEGYKRRGEIRAEYVARTQEYKAQNLAQFKPLTRRGSAGQTRRVFGIGSSGI